MFGIYRANPDAVEMLREKFGLGMVCMSRRNKSHVYSSECIANGNDSLKSFSMICVNLSIPSFIFSHPGSRGITSFEFMFENCTTNSENPLLKPLGGSQARPSHTRRPFLSQTRTANSVQLPAA